MGQWFNGRGCSTVKVLEKYFKRWKIVLKAIEYSILGVIGDYLENIVQHGDENTNQVAICNQGVGSKCNTAKKHI